MPLSTRLPLSGSGLDRCDERRQDRDWLRQQWARARLWLLDDDGRMLAREDCAAPLHLDAASLTEACRLDADDALLLGVDADGDVHFAVQLPAGSDLSAPRVGIREAAARWSATDSAGFACAAAVFGWRRRYRYCPQCGGQLSPGRAGFSLICRSGSGCTEQFPRTDSAVIVVVEHDGRCLLGRQASWPAGVYSALAGFVEPGESLEEAVCREVGEEAGVSLSEVRYRGSQPWPFPHSIMLGFHATAADPALRLGDELEDARWFSPEELAEGFAAQRLYAPSPISISYHLLREWLSMQEGEAASDALARMPAAAMGVRRD